jgi:hypothetical protein
MKALSSLNRNELPTEMVCAVSPAKNNPLGLLHSDLSTKQQHLVASTGNHDLCTHSTDLSEGCPDNRPGELIDYSIRYNIHLDFINVTTPANQISNHGEKLQMLTENQPFALSVLHSSVRPECDASYT